MQNLTVGQRSKQTKVGWRRGGRVEIWVVGKRISILGGKVRLGQNRHGGKDWTGAVSI